MKWSGRRVRRCCASIRFPRWRPGLLRKFFEFPSGNAAMAPQSYAEPNR